MTAFSTVIRQALPGALLAVTLALGTSAAAGPGAPNSYAQTNLVSNVSGVGDPDLINPWGIAFNPNGPVWVATTAMYNSIAIAGTGTDHFFYATDFHIKKIDEFIATFIPFATPNGFLDPNTP